MSLRNPLRIHLWWDTAIGRDINNSVYFEGNAKKTFILRNQLQYVDFVSKVCELMGTPVNSTPLKLTLLHPVQYGNHLRFVSTLISNDEDMEMMYQLQQDYKGLKQIELHVEKGVQLGVVSNVGDSQIAGPNVGDSQTAAPNGGDSLTAAPDVGDSQIAASDFSNPPTISLANKVNSKSHNETGERDPCGMRVYTDAVTKLVQREMARGPMRPAEMDAHGPSSDIEAGTDSDWEDSTGTNEPVNVENRGEAIPGTSAPPSCPQMVTSPRTHCPPGLSYFNRLGDFDSNEATDLGLSRNMDMWSESNSDLSIGMKFENKSEVITAAQLWSMKKGREYRVVESSSNLWEAKCRFLGKTQCQWRMRAILKKKLGVWQLTKFGPEHTCTNSLRGNDHWNLNSRLIAKKILHLIAEDPEVKCKIIKSHIHNALEVQPTYKKCWKGRRFAIEMVYGDWPSSFATLPQFLNAIVQANPGTVVEWRHHISSTEEVKYFRCLFWAFRPCIEAFRSTHNVVSVDSTHIRGAYRGKLLVAATVDANNHVLPLAFALVDEETSDNWGWFLAMLRRHVVGNEQGVCLITNRHKGIINAVSSQVEWQPPMGYHRFCLRHLRRNFSTLFKNATLKMLCWQAGKARQIRKFDGLMESIKHINQDAFKWLSEIPLEMWTLAHDGGFRCGQLTTNLSESYNNVIKGARVLPIKCCVNLTFERLVNYFRQHRDDAAQCDAPFPKKPWKRFRYLEQRSGTHTVQVFNAQIGIFSVTSRRLVNGKGGNIYHVNLRDRHCSCGKWNMFRIPCSHAIAASRQVSVNPVELVSGGYSTAAYRATYDGQFYPIPHEDYWQPLPFSLKVVQDNLQNTRTGRLHTSRIQNEMDEPDLSAMRRCSNCHQPGHNRLKCPSTLTIDPPNGHA